MSGTIYGDEALDLAEASIYLGYSPNTMTCRHKEWNLLPTKIGGRNYWFKADLDAFIARRVQIEENYSRPRYSYPRAA